MRVRFRTRRLERQARSQREAVRALGSQAGRRYIQRVDAIEEASSFDALSAVRAFGIHELKGQRRGTFAIRLTGFDRMIVSVDEASQTLWIEEVSKHYDD